jgi:hypothetical protein
MKSYCTQNNSDCETCSLVKYGRDCRNVPLMADDRQAEQMAVEVVKLSEADFQREMSRAKTFQGLEHDRAEYWTGYQRGLRRAYHGEAFGTMQEHTLWLEAASSDDAMRRQRGQGYRGGLRGKPSDDCHLCGEGGTE